MVLSQNELTLPIAQTEKADFRKEDDMSTKITALYERLSVGDE